MVAHVVNAAEKGCYVVLEGDEGSGKTTQIKLLRERLKRDLGLEVEQIREPGGDPVAEAIRQILLGAHEPIAPIAELFMFLAARANVLKMVVQPLLNRGVWVVADRCYLSSLVYQGYARGLDEGVQNRHFTVFRDTVKWAACPTLPDRIIVLNIPPEVSIMRQLDRGSAFDRMEQEENDFRLKVNMGYHYYVDNQGYNTDFFAVDGIGSIDQVHDRIWGQVLQLFPRTRSIA